MPLRLLLFIVLAMAVLSSVCLRTASATMALPLTLPQLTQQAGRIFVGRCESLAIELDERGIPSTYARFQVEEGLKGVEDGGTVLIKQFGAARAALRVAEGESAVVSPKTMTLAGLSYRAGASYLLFLYPESDWGFTSPVGGGQGQFEIHESGPSAIAVNPLNNRFLETFREGPVPLEDILRKIRGK